MFHIIEIHITEKNSRILKNFLKSSEIVWNIRGHPRKIKNSLAFCEFPWSGINHRVIGDRYKYIKQDLSRVRTFICFIHFLINDSVTNRKTDRC